MKQANLSQIIICYLFQIFLSFKLKSKCFNKKKKRTKTNKINSYL